MKLMRSTSSQVILTVVVMAIVVWPILLGVEILSAVHGLVPLVSCKHRMRSSVIHKLERDKAGELTNSFNSSTSVDA